jgi:hypothetical protein
MSLLLGLLVFVVAFVLFITSPLLFVGFALLFVVFAILYVTVFTFLVMLPYIIMTLVIVGLVYGAVRLFS